MKFEELNEFKKDLKSLLKRYRTLEDDLDVVKKVLTVEPKERPSFSYRIDGLGLKTCVIKIKKMTSRSLKGKGSNSGLRLIYAHFETEKKIVIIELYHKNDKENEDKERILRNFKRLFFVATFVIIKNCLFEFNSLPNFICKSI